MNDEARCTARSKQSGEQCKRGRQAGLDKCYIHAGLSRAQRELAARKQQAEKAVVTYGLRRDISATDALLEEVQWTAGHVAWLRQQVASLAQGDLIWGVTEEVRKAATEFPGTDVTEAATASMWLELYYRERKHLVEVCKAAISAGIEERRVRLAEAQGALLNEVLRRIFARLGLTSQQSALLPVVVPEELRRAAIGALN